MNVTYKNVVPLVEALKQAGRVVLIAVLPVLIVQLESRELNLESLAIVGGIAILSFIDKLMHLSGKVSGDETLTGGLTRF